jgi:L-ascorbate metabolism protein UlaG (beta-lactamase superfamily)
MSSAAVTWWGHAMVEIEMDGVHLLTDPLLRGRVGPLDWYGPMPSTDLAQRTDAVLISHLHRDHLDLGSLARFDPATTIVVPRGAGEMVRSRAAGQVIELASGDSTSIGGVGIHAVPAVHPDRRDPHRSTPRAAPLGYLVTGSRRVYFAGDTDVFEAMTTLGDGLDLALLPIGGWGLTRGAGHLDPRAAVEALRLLRPRIVVPIHWGSLRVPGLWRLRADLFTGAGASFARHARGPDGVEGVEVVIAEPGTVIRTVS